MVVEHVVTYLNDVKGVFPNRVAAVVFCAEQGWIQPQRNASGVYPKTSRRLIPQVRILERVTP